MKLTSNLAKLQSQRNVAINKEIEQGKLDETVRNNLEKNLQEWVKLRTTIENPVTYEMIRDYIERNYPAFYNNPQIISGTGGNTTSTIQTNVTTIIDRVWSFAQQLYQTVRKLNPLRGLLQ